MPFSRGAVGALCVASLLLQPLLARGQRPTPDLSSASLEELMNIHVTTVAKREQPLSGAAAAVYVITADDIRRSGAETLADALRLAPGVEVAQISANTWATSIRGFNSEFANKLLVLIDGRTVYSPTFSGVFWDEQDLLLEDIERIEVIRGPGATMWGTNAVNGVINIITRSSADTKGALLGAGVGTLQGMSVYARYGGRIGEHGNYRIYFKQAHRSDLPLNLGTSANDGWTSNRGGFRSDWSLSSRDFLTVQGDGAGGGSYDDVPLWQSSASFPGYASFDGGNLLARWRHVTLNGSELRAQVYFDHAREWFPGIIELRHDSFDLDIQHNIKLGKRHDVVWGGTFRNVRQRSRGTDYAELIPSSRTLRIFSGFVQDDIAISNAVHLIGGSKFESNVFTGLEIQPTVRLMFTPSKRHAIWAAVSRAMRSPSESEISTHNLLPIATAFGPGLALLLGNPACRSEELLAYEAGYRTQATQRLSFDIAGFINRYHHQQELIPAQVAPPAPDVVSITLLSAGRARTYGLEVTAAYFPVKRWKLTGSYSFLHMSNPGGGMPTVAEASPEHQFQVHSLWTLPGAVEFDSHLYFIGAQPEAGVRRYTRADVRLGWRMNQHLEWSLTGQNLLDSAHPEFSTGFAGPIQIRRSVFAKMTWRF